MSRSNKTKVQMAALTASTVLLVPMVALGWSQGADFETGIHGHDFSRATLESSDCDLKASVLFSAPEQGYKSGSPERNIYRFHVRIKLDGGHALVTRVFNNKAPGARAYSFTLGTQAEGCWAKEARKIQGIDVEGCRGAGCNPEPFK